MCTDSAPLLATKFTQSMLLLPSRLMRQPNAAAGFGTSFRKVLVAEKQTKARRAACKHALTSPSAPCNPAFALWQAHDALTASNWIHALSLCATGRPQPGRAWLLGTHASHVRTGRSQSTQHAAATAWRCRGPGQPHSRIHNSAPRFSPSQNPSSQNFGRLQPC